MKLLAFSMLLLATNSSYAKSTWNNFDFNDLRQLVLTKKISDLDNLIKHLPSEMKQNPILVYHSKALHPELASLEKPRMLFFNNDGTLAITIAGNPGTDYVKSNLDVLEVISFNKKSGEFEMYVDSFNQKNQPFKKLNKNPATCLSCHGNNPRPLFHDYNGWPGVYGSFGTQGVAAKDSAEWKGLSSFLEQSKNNERYSDLDLSGFYNYPAKDKKDRSGNITPAGTAGIGYRIQNTEHPAKKVFDAIYATPHLYYGMRVEDLMHKRLAKKLSLRDDFVSTVFPIFYYLGNTSKEAGKVEGRCGHPSNNTRKVYSKLTELFPENEEKLQVATQAIKSQILKDHNLRKSEVELFNQLSPIVDDRGIASIPFTAFFPTPINNSPDQEGFEKQSVLVEVLFQRLNLKTEYLSSSKDTPTTGIFQLVRLGLMPIDEKYFQNLMGGFEWATPALKNKFDSLSCEKVEALAMKGVESLFAQEALKLKYDGVQYKNKFDLYQ